MKRLTHHKFYTEPELRLMRAWYHRIGPRPMARLLNIELGIVRSVPSVTNKARKIGLRYTGPKKGLFHSKQIPHNKGKKLSPSGWKNPANRISSPAMCLHVPNLTAPSAFEIATEPLPLTSAWRKASGSNWPATTGNKPTAYSACARREIPRRQYPEL